MTSARESLTGNWGIAIGGLLVYMLVFGLICCIPFLGMLAMLICAGAFYVGFYSFYMAIARGEEAQIGMLFSGFKQMAQSFCAFWLAGIFTFLWSLLLIVPGIMAALSYSLIYFIMKDHPEMKAMDVIGLSKKAMYGYRWKLFCLFCRFIGWYLLCILTLGIGFLWFIPYFSVSFAKFYDDAMADYVAKNPATA